MKEWREDDLANGSQPVEGASQSTTALTEPGPSKVQEKSQAKPSNNKVPKVSDPLCSMDSLTELYVSVWCIHLKFKYSPQSCGLVMPYGDKKLG